MLATLLIDEGYTDSATSVIAALLREHNIPTDVVSLPKFLNEHGFHYDRDEGWLKWNQAQDGLQRHKSDDTMVINRAVSVSDQTLSLLDGGDRTLTVGQVLAACAQLFTTMPTVLGRPGKYSPLGDMLPLNLQWKLFASHRTSIATPKFLYGFGAAKLDVSHFARPLWKSPSDMYSWKSSAELQPDLQPFVVDRPEGKAVLLYFVQEAARVISLEEGAVLSDSARQNILSCPKVFRAIFRASMGEALFFVDGDSVTFGAFSHYLKTAMADAHFKDVVTEGLLAGVKNSEDTRSAQQA